MSKQKLLRYAQFSSMPHCYECADFMHPQLTDHQGQRLEVKGRWAADVFGNTAPLTLELGCGRGEYTVGLAERHPERNFIGIDLKGNRMHVGATAALQKGLTNVRFVRSPIECLGHFFGAGEVAQIWITFADPQPLKPKKRLTSERFLGVYAGFLAEEHLLHLKTDSDILYQSTLEVLQAGGHRIHYQNADIYAQALDYTELAWTTYYERLHTALGKRIKYLRFSLKPALLRLGV